MHPRREEDFVNQAKEIGDGVKPVPTSRDPATLRPHAKVKHLVGRWAKDSDKARALRRSIKEQGIQQPLIITTDGEILDGVTRWEAATALQLAEVPVVVREEAEALEVLLASECRRHMSASQRAFTFAPFVKEAFARRAAMMAQMIKLPSHERTAFAHTPNGEKTVADYAAQIGVSVRLLEQANELHRLFEANPEPRAWTGDDAVANLALMGRKRGAKLTFAEYYVPMIHHDEHGMGLGAVKAGIQSILSGSTVTVNDIGAPKQLRLWQEAWSDVATRYEYWNKFDDEAKAKAATAIGDSLTQAPDDYLDTLRKKVAAELRRREQEGKES
jgi:hypothetical protein